MSHYMFLSDIDGPRWALMGLVVKLAHSVSTRPHRITPIIAADPLWFSAVFVRCHSHTTEVADCILQTGIAVDGVWIRMKLADGVHFSGRYTPMIRGRYDVPEALVVFVSLLIPTA
jgi:hypothetical protein